MKIEILCSDPLHPVNARLEQWRAKHAASHSIRIARKSTEVTEGDMLFLISCHEIVNKDVRKRFRHVLVIHASDLPQGRGMSPHIWQILEGKNTVSVALLNAEDALDSGDIWRTTRVRLEGHELFDEINDYLFDAELDLMDWAVQNCDTSVARHQEGEPTYYRRRRPEDSRIDPKATIESQFDAIRVADPTRYPAFFELRGKTYKLEIRKIDGEKS